ncbi:MAG TPA: VWA domain-containing protein [Acidimicrobiia bacterium]|nr:VWA domain-containing protein [Acidimicrobiia bacterium]
METDRGPLPTLLDFSRFVRRRDLPVGTDDVMAFTTAAALLDPGRLEDIYWAGRVTLVHGRNQIPIYNACFTEYFLGGTSDDASHAVPRKLSARGAESVFDVPSGDQPEDGQEQEETRLGAEASSVIVNHSKAFAECTDEELESLRRIISSLRATPPLRRTRRHRSSNRGRRLDLRKMARETMRSHGEPGELWWRKRRKRPRPLVLLLDISGSMADYSRNLLQFAHSTRAATSRMEAFCFGTHLTRITPSLRRRNPDDALEQAGKEVVDWAGGTQIGASLDTFVRRYARRGMARGALVIICSDGLDRGDPALLDDALERLGRLCYRIVWMNPMKGDAEQSAPTSLGMSVALPHIDVLWSGHNLANLEAFAEQLATI